jgi:hypothetical protein
MRARDEHLTVAGAVEAVGPLVALALLALSRVLDSDPLGWAAAAAVVVTYGGRLVSLRRGEETDARPMDPDTRLGCAVFTAVAVTILALAAAAIGALVGLVRGAPPLDDAWAGARVVLLLAVLVLVLRGVEHLLVHRRRP